MLCSLWFWFSPAKPGGRVRCQYYPSVDKVLFVDDYAVGCRKDLNGILLLDTALQAPVAKPEDMVQLELPVTEVRLQAPRRRHAWQPVGDERAAWDGQINNAPWLCWFRDVGLM